LEAESIEVVSSDDKVLAATFIAYDHNTGLGLVRAKEPLEVAPCKLGHSAEVHKELGLFLVRREKGIMSKVLNCDRRV
jgi:S1-C subfamily serine protease